MNWEKRHEELLLTKEETEVLDSFVDSLVERTKPSNPLEFGFLSEQLARTVGYRVAVHETEAKVKFMKNSTEAE